MRHGLRSLMLFGLVALLSSCAFIKGKFGSKLPDTAKLEEAKRIAEEGAKKIKASKDRAFAECAPLETKVVSWPEERAIGGAISINHAMKGKGLYVDITEKNLKTLQAKAGPAGANRAAVTLTPSEKNDLNAYVEVVGLHVASFSARPGIPWTFAVLEDATPNAVAAPAGYVFITTGLLAMMENEAQLAGVIGHEIGHVTAKHAINSYQSAKIASCKIALTGYYLVEAGASNVPGGEEFVKNAKFGKTMKAFADPDGVDMDKDPQVDKDFMVWFTNRVIDAQALMGYAKEDEFDADRIGAELTAAAGYDPKELEKLIEKIPEGGGSFAHHPSNKERVEALVKARATPAFGTEGGKTPPFRSTVKWPKKPTS